MSGKSIRRERNAKRDAWVRAVLQKFIDNLRDVLRRCAPLHFQHHPNARRPCDTCAFNPSTDKWVGADATAWHLQQAIGARTPFYCHHDMKLVVGVGYIPDPTNLVTCTGYDIVKSHPDTKKAFTKAAREVGTPRAEVEKLLGRTRVK